MTTSNAPVPPPRRGGAASAPSSANTLENGDRLTRGEFERRYEARPDIRKAELIEGVVHMPSPTRSGSHARPHAAAITWLGSYAASTPGVQVNDNPTVRLDRGMGIRRKVIPLMREHNGLRARVRSRRGLLQGAPAPPRRLTAGSSKWREQRHPMAAGR